MKKQNILAAISLLLVLLPVGAVAQARRPLMPDGRLQRDIRTPRIRLMAVLETNQKELKITDEQLEKVRALMDSHRENLIKMEADLELKRLELGKLMRPDKIRDYAKIESRLEAVSAVRQNMMIESMKNRDAIMGVFTPEQNEAVKRLFKQRREQRASIMRRDRLTQRFPRRDFRDFRRDPRKPRFPEDPSAIF